MIFTARMGAAAQQVLRCSRQVARAGLITGTGSNAGVRRMAANRARLAGMGSGRKTAPRCETRARLTPWVLRCATSWGAVRSVSGAKGQGPKAALASMNMLEAEKFCGVVVENEAALLGGEAGAEDAAEGDTGFPDG